MGKPTKEVPNVPIRYPMGGLALVLAAVSNNYLYYRSMLIS
jgi:hypothetical protein